MKHLSSTTATCASVKGRPLNYLKEGTEYCLSLFLNCNDRSVQWPCACGGAWRRAVLSLGRCAPAYPPHPFHRTHPPTRPHPLPPAGLIIAQSDPDSLEGHGVALHPRVIGELSQTDDAMRLTVLHPAEGGDDGDGSVSEVTLTIRKRSAVAAARIVTAFGSFWRGDVTAPALLAATTTAAAAPASGGATEDGPAAPAAGSDKEALVPVAAAKNRVEVAAAARALSKAAAAATAVPAAPSAAASAASGAPAPAVSGDVSVVVDSGAGDKAGKAANGRSDDGAPASPEAEAAAALGRILRSAASHARVRGSMTPEAYTRWRLREVVNGVAMESAVLAGVPMSGLGGVVFDPSGQARTAPAVPPAATAASGAAEMAAKLAPAAAPASPPPRPAIPRLPLEQALGGGGGFGGAKAASAAAAPAPAPAPSDRSSASGAAPVAVAARHPRLAAAGGATGAPVAPSPLGRHTGRESAFSSAASASSQPSVAARPQAPARSAPSPGPLLSRSSSYVGSILAHPPPPGSAPPPPPPPLHAGAPVIGPNGELQPPLPPGPPPPLPSALGPARQPLSEATGAVDADAVARHLAMLAAAGVSRGAAGTHDDTGASPAPSAHATAAAARLVAEYQRQLATLAAYGMAPAGGARHGHADPALQAAAYRHQHAAAAASAAADAHYYAQQQQLQQHHSQQQQQQQAAWAAAALAAAGGGSAYGAHYGYQQ